METTVAGAALLLVVVFLIRRLLQTKIQHLNLPPSGPFRLPVLGHLHHLRPPLHLTFSRLSARYGPLLFLHLGSRPILLVTSPDIAEECFTTNDVVFANRPVVENGKHLTYNYTTLGSAPYGPYWRNLRRISTIELFTPARLAALSAVRAAEVHHLVRHLLGGAGAGFRRVELKPMFTELLVNTIMQTVVGKRYYGESAAAGPAEGQRFRRILKEVFRVSVVSCPEDFLPFLRWMGLNSQNKQLVAAHREMDELFQEIIDERRREGDAGERRTLLDGMLSLQETDPEYYTDIVIKGMILIFLEGGTETSSGTMEWAMSLLLNNPKALQKLKAEIETQVGHERLLADSDLPNLPYLNNVIKETLRLFPAIPLLLPHRSSSECKVRGYHIPTGTFLFVNVYAMNRDPSLWTEPTKFKPERFEDGEGEGYNFIPFGSGRRKCPGNVLAARVMGLTLGTLIQCFDWVRIGEMEVDLTEDGTISLYKAVSLEALCKPRENMINILSQL